MSQLRVYDYVNQPFLQVSDVISRDPHGVIRRATTVASARAEELDAQLHARVGRLSVEATIDLTIGPIDRRPLPSGRDALRVPLSWSTDPVRIAFPMMEATLTVYPLTSSETQIELVGRYDPPLGVLGRVFDEIVLDEIVEASILRFVQEIATYLREQPTETSTVGGHA